MCKTLNKGWFIFHVERVISAVFTSGGFYKFTCHWVKPLAVPCLSFASANDFYLFCQGILLNLAIVDMFIIRRAPGMEFLGKRAPGMEFVGKR